MVSYVLRFGFSNVVLVQVKSFLIYGRRLEIAGALEDKIYIKNKYCEDNNIKLLRIPYWEFKNMRKIIIDFITNND